MNEIMLGEFTACSEMTPRLFSVPSEKVQEFAESLVNQPHPDLDFLKCSFVTKVREEQGQALLEAVYTAW